MPEESSQIESAPQATAEVETLLGFLYFLISFSVLAGLLILFLSILAFLLGQLL